MRDPLDELRNLDAGTAGRALPAAEVRRRGDRMRRRRTAVHALGAAAAVAVIASGGALATGVTSTAPRPADPAAPTTSTSPSPTETDPAVASEIPEDFPIWEGIEPTEGWEDAVPEGASLTDLDDELDQSWYGLPCTSAGEQVTFPGDDRRTSALRVWMEGDFWGKSRQLFVYEDFAAATQAFTRLGSTMTACAKSGETPPDAQPMDWSVESMPGNKDTPSWVIAQGSSTGDGSHAFFVDLTATQVGRSVFVSRSGRGQKERLDWQRLEDSHNVVLRAAWCLWMEGPCGDEQPKPAETAETAEPADFDKEVITRGLPEPGGDVPEWAWSEGEPLRPVACGGAEDLPDEPVANDAVEVFPPDEHASRHLLVFRTEGAAVAALEQLRSSAVVCNELVGSAPDDDPTDPSETRWTLQEYDGSPVVLGIDGLTYADGTDTLVPGRTLTRAVQVGRALLVAQVSDGSSAGGDDEVAARLTADVAGIAGEMCSFTDVGCETD